MDDRSTNALVRRNEDQRTRNRRAAMAVPSGNADAYRSKAEKYYCPGCGQVRRPESVFEALASRPVYEPVIIGDRIMPHEFSTGLRELEYCPGGTFDRLADAA